ncbi:receptor-type tyrosine-protein phosphatase eta [Rhineura floridana]|uniref:receptor-type tyrosine-protein phosphatase eta n=1 Tax=Rhineura floridana TaxID=261503 RepID=UPI002AC82F14|nr:receptor-type tyrosine-protein phosphatase eta [Rhineura floridana]
MRRLALLVVSFLLCLGKITVAAVCVNECKSVNNVTVSETEIHIQLPDNFTISNVTFANGTEAKPSPWNATISGLVPGSQYIVSFENSDGTCCRIITTKPSPVFDIRVESINTTTVSLKWNSSDPNASIYTYRIQIEGSDPPRNEYSYNASAVISALVPGTLYTFKIYPQVDGNKTEGDPNDIAVSTKPSPVSGISVENCTNTTVTLKWNNSDPNVSVYTYEILIEGSDLPRTESNTSSAIINDLEPGTLYTFKIYSEIHGKTKGDPNGTTVYTKPSPVSGISVENRTNTTVTLKWDNSDPNASNYTYRIQIEGSDPLRNEYSDNASAVISALVPGTLYTFKIYARADGNNTEGDPNDIAVYTKPSPVSGISVENRTNTTVTLKWDNSDPNASNYTYRIQIEGSDPPRNEYSDNASAVISALVPGTLYTFKIYARADGNNTEWDPNDIAVYTKPSPVSGISVENRTNTTVTLKWDNSDPNVSVYTYRIQIEGSDPPRNEYSDNASAVISALVPGTLYTFKIYARADGNNTEGDPNDIAVYTRPSPVFGINVENYNNTTVNLTWRNDDANAFTYTYRIQIQGNGTTWSETSNATSAVISHLEPGTLYTFKIYPIAADKQTEGDLDEKAIYTKPSPVSGFHVVSISTSTVTLSWEDNDASSSGYTYIVLYQLMEVEMYVTSQDKNVTIEGLKPGTLYRFSVFPQAEDNLTRGDPQSIGTCTDAARVDMLNCMQVAKQPELILNWTYPNGSFVGFRIDILNIYWNETLPVQNETKVTNLDYYTNYTVRIVTLSCGNDSVPREERCLTSIGDPPPLPTPPTVKATSHNSLKVQFGSFNSSHGPLEAYAVIITSKDVHDITNEDLKYTYDDFINKKTNAYVAVVESEQKRSSSSPNSQQYDIEVGDGSRTHGYLNGKLYPLGSYRACVAGFTRIAYLNETISAEKSYVSLSPISGPVDLPQDPGVIIGAVVGCILGAAVIAATVLFIFWKKRRKDGKNTDVPFSPIEPKKSKLVKVENYESYFKKQKADSNCGFAEEYEDLRQVGVNQPKFAAELPENKGKNRYNNVLPYDISRVKLSIQNHPTTDYINANYMPAYNSKKEFIAAQGPLPNTVQDFWRMIWEKKIYAVVMLTKCIEQGRTKCEEYWPNKQSKHYGDITVAMTSEIALPEWTIRDFSMEKSDSSESHPVRQFHFTAWPDHGVPETTDLLISFRHMVQEYMKQNPPTSPTLVHCSAGVGRTGTFIAIDRLIHQMEMENTVDVYGVVYDLRMHRSLMVQTEDQYVFLNQCVLDIIKSQKEKKGDLIYQNTNAMAIYENFTPSPATGKANGYHI